MARAEALHDQTGRTAWNGTAMRTAPIALAASSVEQASRAARADARLTHRDAAASAASAAVCAALLALDAGDDPFAAAAGEAAAPSARGDGRRRPRWRRGAGG